MLSLRSDTDRADTLLAGGNPWRHGPTSLRQSVVEVPDTCEAWKRWSTDLEWQRLRRRVGGPPNALFARCRAWAVLTLLKLIASAGLFRST
jgi:hypothetical protein